ncbi:MAG TPA: hypothetical protein DDW52_01965 [Planctomycetaceae bacterium]|nr:hypothetical protein [Planctomycetaceae bacterium]
MSRQPNEDPDSQEAAGSLPSQPDASESTSPNADDSRPGAALDSSGTTPDSPQTRIVDDLDVGQPDKKGGVSPLKVAQPETDPSETAPPELPSIDLDRQSVSDAATTLDAVYRYAAGLRERTLRSASALREAVRESSDWLISSSFRNAQSYNTFARQMLDYVVNDLPNTRIAWPTYTEDKHRDLARKTVGNLFDMTALATFPLSPITVLAVYSESRHGIREYLDQLCELLRDHMIIDSAKMQSSEELLVALKTASREATDVFAQPPIATEKVEEIWAQLREPERDCTGPSAEEVSQLWLQMQLAAVHNDASIWDIAATISIFTLSGLPSDDAHATGDALALEVANNVTINQLAELYWAGLRAIERNGLVPTLSLASEPYLDSIWSSLTVKHRNWGEQLLSGELLSGELLKWGWSRWSWPTLRGRNNETMHS